MEVAESKGESSVSAFARTKRFWNWKLIVVEAAIAFLGFYVFNATTIRRPQIPGILGVLIGVLFLWLLVREFYGIAIDSEAISFPTNRVRWFPLLSSGRRRIRAADVRSITVAQPWYGFQVAKIAGDFGSDLLVFQSRGQRRRFTSIAEQVCPRLVVYRSKTVYRALT
jgi:hypothetical protein